MNTAFIPSRLAEKVLCNHQQLLLSKSDIPLQLCSTGRRYRYPLKHMAVGEHFFVPLNGRNLEKLQNTLSSSVCYAQRTFGMKFTQRRYPNGIRVWRTA